MWPVLLQDSEARSRIQIPKIDLKFTIMPSQARKDLNDRLTDIDQILQAHQAITKFKKAEAAANKAGKGIQNIINVVNALVNNPGKGKPSEVASLNRGAFVLICAHFQGFVEDLHKETASYMLAGKVVNIDEVVNLVKPRHSNPHSDVIEKMFSGIGIYDLMKKVHWKKCNNESVRKKISKYIEERNQIAHGKKVTIHKSKVVGFKRFVILLSDQLDAVVGKQINTNTKKEPW